MKKLLLLLSLLLATNVWPEEIRRYFSNDGSLEEEATFVNGKLDGPYSDYHENGNYQSIGQYSNDEMSGSWRFFSNDGYIFEDKGDIDKALEYHNRELQILEVMDYKYELGDCLKNIGDVYFDKNENNKAIGYYNRALAIYYEIDDRHEIERLLPRIEEANSK